MAIRKRKTIRCFEALQGKLFIYFLTARGTYSRTTEAYQVHYGANNRVRNSRGRIFSFCIMDQLH